MDGLNRRNFVKVAAAAGAIGSVKSFAVAKPTANDTELRISLVGCGGRGSGAAAQALQCRKGIKLVAMADAFGDKVESSHGRIAKTMKAQVDVPPERRFSGFDAYKKAID